MQINSIGAASSNNSQAIVDKPPITEEYAQRWIQQLEQWTNIFYNEHGARNPIAWQESQAKLVQFQKIHDPFELCMRIIKNSRNSLVLYQATLCLKNAVANDFKKFDMDELFKLFQFLYEFLCMHSLDNDMCVNETTALICAMILKRIASERSRALIASFISMQTQDLAGKVPLDKEADQITQVITTLCSHIQEPNEALSKKVAASMMLSSLLLECQMTNRSTLLGIRVWKHLNARRHFESHLKQITEVCLATINWTFSSNLLNPVNQTRETQILFHLVGSLIQCIENSLAFNSSDTGCNSGGDRVLRVIQSRTINMLSQTNEHDQRLKTLREWCKMVMAPSVVQFLFDLYTTVKSMVNMVPGWTWPSNILKNCLNCLYYLSDVHNTVNIERDSTYAEFVGNLMIGAVKLMDTETQGIDDSFQIACLITSISMHTSETRDTISMVKAEHFIPFLDSAQRFTCKVFTQVATTSNADVEEEEEKTIDALLDFWYHLLRNIDAEIRSCVNAQTSPKVSPDGLKAYSRMIVESYISCHLHQPLGQLVPKGDDDIKEVDLDQADEQDDNSIHGQQLVSFGQIARFDALHTAKLLIELLSTRVTQFEALLTQFINTKQSPDGIKDWEYINDDIHWLLLMLQHYLTQTGYGEIGFMCNEILDASLSFGANVQKTLEAFEKCDFSLPDTDPIVRLVIITLKLCQIEMSICQSGKTEWLSVQTNGTLTTLLSRFCLTYLYPRESDYSIISENMNYCFGQDAPTADKFLRFVIEHTCCIILYLKTDPQIVKKNITLLIQLQTFHSNVMRIMLEAEPGSMTSFVRRLKPDELTGFSPQVAKLILKLATRLFVDEEDWSNLIDFFTKKWSFFMTCIQNNQHQSEAVVNKFLEFCDFSMGVCEACDDESSERIFEQLLVPIVKALPEVMKAFSNFENVTIAIFDLLYYNVKLPMINLSCWDSPASKSFYENCIEVIRVYSMSPLAKKERGTDDDSCDDIVALLNFAHEVMKRDWGNSWASCDAVVKFAMEKLSVIIKPEYLQFPKIRSTYYRLLVYLVDEDDRLNNLNDTLLNMLVSSVLLALQSKFDKDVDNHVYTIIGIVCRTIFSEKGTQVSERLSKFMLPILPALFHSIINSGSFTLNTETAEMVGPAFFSLRCCYMNVYQSLVKDLIEKQDDPYARAKVTSLFENLEAKISKLTLNRSACREFNGLFVPFLAELHNYVTTK